jgi:hypothetical protein
LLLGQDVIDRMAKGHPINRLAELLPWNRTAERIAAARAASRRQPSVFDTEYSAVG